MRIGIDLGGTKIEAVVLSDSGDIVYRQRVPTPANDYRATVAAIVELVHLVEQSVEGLGAESLATVGIATPGSPSLVDGRMKNCNSTCLNGQFLQRDIEQQLERAVRIANDANCFALSESVDGVAAGEAVVFGVILGTGVGGGLIVNGRPLVGRSGIGSEWGHNILPGVGVEFANEQRPCYCGNRNCIETYLSGEGLVQSYILRGGKRASAREIAQSSVEGESLAREVMALYQQQLAYALSQIINVVDPDVVVLGGGLSNIESLYEEVPHYWAPWIFSDTVATRLLPARYGDSSGVRGAAWLWA